MARYLLITDVDDTVLGDPSALERWATWMTEHPGLVAVAYCSGRFVDSVLESVGTSFLPPPVAVVGGVGTEMRTWPEGQFAGPGQPVSAWRERLARDFDVDVVRARLVTEPDLDPQPDAEQGPFKASYYLPGASRGRLDELKRELDAAGVESDYVYSSELDLDFLPSGVDKGAAAVFLAEHLGYEPSRVFVAGNSGNDAALFGRGFRGIVVGNAHEELRAVEGPEAYLAEGHIADGVREGLEHWLRADGALPER